MPIVTYVHVIGVEGCGHHGLYPVLKNSLEHEGTHAPDRPMVVLGRWTQLRKLFDKLWYEPHADADERARVCSAIDNLMERLTNWPEFGQKERLILEDRSFPARDRRKPEQQWDLLEMSLLMRRWADIRYILMYRNPIAMSFSHPAHDGELRAHAQVLAAHLEYLNQKLQTLAPESLLVVHYEDLLQNQDKVAAGLANYLHISEASAHVGLQAVRASGRDWRTQMDAADRQWIEAFFNPERLSRWPIFQPFTHAGTSVDE